MCSNNGDCSNCKTQCPMSKIANTLSNLSNDNKNDNSKTELKKEENKNMSLGSCSSGDVEKIARLDERTGVNKLALFISGVFIILAIILAWGLNDRLSDTKGDIRELRSEVKSLQKELNETKIEMRNSLIEMKELKDEANRNYNNARKTVSRINSSQ